MAFTAIVGRWGGEWLDAARQTTRFLMARAFAPDLQIPDFVRLTGDLLWRLFLPLVLAGGALVIVTLAAQLAVTRFGISAKKLTPDFNRLNPLARLRELPRQNLHALIQAMVLLPLFGASVYFICRDRFDQFFVLPLEGVEAGARQVGTSLIALLWRGAGLFLVFGLVDLVRERQRYRRDLRMSKQEIRDEFKEIGRQSADEDRASGGCSGTRMRRRMMQEVPTATAVIVNPTHYAVAIRYELDSMAAPEVVAKGKNYLALRIRAAGASRTRCRSIENPPLAQALYKSVEVGQEIPPHLYRAVAEILAYIYRLMNGRVPA